MTDTTLPKIFLSYSRRQLYFAESLALHLQKEGLDVWFDLQQLQAGAVWADGLKDGIRDAGLLVLVVSEASLASPYVEEEWRGVLSKGDKVVLAVYENVDLPAALQGLPTYDFRTGFQKKMHDLAAYLKGEADPKYDKFSSPSRLSVFSRMPLAVWITLIAQFSLLISSILVLLFFFTFESAWEVFNNMGPVAVVLISIFLTVGIWYGGPFLRHRQTYKKVKRSVLLSGVLMIPSFIVMLVVVGKNLNGVTTAQFILAYSLLLALLVLDLLVFFVVLRRSASFLRWMQPEEGLQRLRRKLHQPLIAEELFDQDMKSTTANEGVSYTIHHTAADRPLANWVRNSFHQVGHQLVPLDKNPQHHIAILSNRSSEAWVQEVTQSYAGQLVYIVVSTIEFKESLQETGRYQWIDARNMDQRDIIGLAKGLGGEAAWRRKAALESTPGKIDSWKVPIGISVLKRGMEVIGAYVLIFGLLSLLSLTGLLEFDKGEYIADEGPLVIPILLTIIGVLCFWIISRALVYRKISAAVVYGFALVSIILISWLGEYLLPPFLADYKWLLPVFMIPVLAFSAINGRFWLPAFSEVHQDEVGIKKSIARGFRRKRIIMVVAWIALAIGSVIWFYFQA